MRPHVEPALLDHAVQCGLLTAKDVSDARESCGAASSRLAWLLREGRLPAGSLGPLYAAAVKRPERLGTDEADRYVPLAALGSGGAADVVLYRDEWRDDFLAVKFPGAMMHEDGAFERLLREPRALCRLSHPAIVALVDVRPVEERLAILMELVPGGTLRHRMLRQAGGWPIPAALEVLEDVLTGLEAAHEHGIVHRDVKPENLLVTAPGGHRVKLTDFGLARCTWRATTTCTAAGTVHYMAPEALEGRATEQSDVYSAGVLAYELFAGVRPIEGRSYVEVSTKILDGAAVPLLEVAPALPRALAEAVMRSIAPAPENRFPSARAMLDALVDATRPASAPVVPKATSVAAPKTTPAVAPLPGQSLRRWLATAPRDLRTILATSGALVRALDRAWSGGAPCGAVDDVSILVDEHGGVSLELSTSSIGLADERREAAAILIELALRFDPRRLTRVPALVGEVPGYPAAADDALRACLASGSASDWDAVSAALHSFDESTDWIAHAVSAARALASAGHLDRVAELVRGLLESHPGTADLHLALADAYNAHGHPEWARSAEDAALAGTPRSLAAAVGVARLARTRGRHAMVLPLVEPALADPALAREARTLKAFALAGLGRKHEAVAELERAVAQGAGPAVARILEKWKREPR